MVATRLKSQASTGESKHIVLLRLIAGFDMVHTQRRVAKFAYLFATS